MTRKKSHSKIAVVDLETDPFAFRRMVYPFVAGFYDGKTYKPFWGDDCIAQLVAYLSGLPEPHTIYAHNGGKFDYFYFLEHLHSELRIVNGRIIQAWLDKHELRDSFAILPFALETYKKTKIDYQKFTRERRNKHRTEIIAYLRDDCVDLYELCKAFRAEFGTALTIGGAAMKQLKRFHSFDSGNAGYDAKFRELYYFGGRNQVFKSGTIEGPMRVYDVNSMYPYVMRSCLHPVSTAVTLATRITKRTAFVTVEGRNYGAFPRRMDDGSLDFTIPRGRFHTTIHEFKTAVKTGTFIPERIISTLNFDRMESFGEFVTHFYDARRKADAEGDKIHKLFYKFVLNSAYGKFAQNPENYRDWYITPRGEYPKGMHFCSSRCAQPCSDVTWTPTLTPENYIIWSKHVTESSWYNIATGASITGAARAVLLDGLSHATDPYYCDTDSIICKQLRGVEKSDTELGSWKLEATGDKIAIAGKKMYAVFKGDRCIKTAHKGARFAPIGVGKDKEQQISGDAIIRIAKGEEIESENPVPAFKWNGEYSFTSRTIRRTTK